MNLTDPSGLSPNSAGEGGSWSYETLGIDPPPAIPTCSGDVACNLAYYKALTSWFYGDFLPALWALVDDVGDFVKQHQECISFGISAATYVGAWWAGGWAGFGIGLGAAAVNFGLETYQGDATGQKTTLITTESNVVLFYFQKLEESVEGSGAGTFQFSRRLFGGGFLVRSLAGCVEAESS